MNNKPTLFVNSISCSEIGKENQNLYDSRRNIKGKVFHRIDDIIGFISIAKKVFVLLNYSNNIFYGEINKKGMLNSIPIFLTLFYSLIHNIDVFRSMNQLSLIKYQQQSHLRLQLLMFYHDIVSL